jgi:pimeloyl-ACP methyl ester carboxylesterase
MQVVRKRIAFFISGFDPRGPAHYYSLFKEEAAKQSAVTGHQIHVSPRQGSTREISQWSTEFVFGDQQVQTEHVFLRWDDIVRDYWPSGLLPVFGSMLSSYWTAITRGNVLTLLRLRPPFILTLFLPMLILLMSVTAGLACGALAVFLSSDRLANLGVALNAFGQALIGAIGFVVATGAIQWRYARLRLYWMLRIFRVTALRSRDSLGQLDQREQRFAAQIEAACASGEYDEVLVVGHSMGAQMGVGALSCCVASNPQGTPVSFLSLGQSIPSYTFLQGSDSFKQRLFAVGGSPRIRWIDVTAPHDGICFAFVDPVTAAGGTQRDPDHPSPKLINARFAKLFTPRVYRSLRKDRFRIHFQYIMASELAGEYDYFALVAGPQRLEDAFANRQSVVAGPYRLFKRRFT